MKKAATLILTKLECVETTKETKHDEVALYVDQMDAGYPSKAGRYIFEREGVTQSINLEIHDVENMDSIYLKLVGCDGNGPNAKKEETIGKYSLSRDEVYRAYDWESLPEGALPPEEKSIRFDKNSDGCEVNAAVYCLHYRVVTNPIPTVRVLGDRCEQRSAGHNQEAIEAILNVAIEATKAAVRVSRESAGDYLLKSINIDELSHAVNRVQNLDRNAFSQQLSILQDVLKIKGTEDAQRFAVTTTKGLQFFDLENLIRLEADGKYTRCYAQGGKTFLSSKNLGGFEKILNPNWFYRIHHSHVINLKSIITFSRTEQVVTMENGDRVGVSQRRRLDFLKRFQMI